MNSNIRAPSRIRLALSTLLLMSGASAGSSAFADEVRSETVKFYDLNMATPEGVKALYGRIHLAAERVCFQSDPVLRSGNAACARKTEANAIEKVNLPQLTAYYNLKAKTGDHGQALIAAR